MFAVKTCFYGFSWTAKAARSVTSHNLLPMIANRRISVFDIIPKFAICKTKLMFALKTCFYRFSNMAKAVESATTRDSLTVMAISINN